MARVLVVEDEPDLRRLIVVLLELVGYDVTEAPHGQAALDHIRDAGLPDLVITDRAMPVMDGLTMIERLRAEPATRDVPVMMLSANPPAHVDVLTLRKPFAPDHLLDAVSTFGLMRSGAEGDLP